jgi:hypothetical protein
VPSTLHQCIKYKDASGDIVRIFADKKPFTVAESFYADAKLYFEPVDKVSTPKTMSMLEPDSPSKERGESSSKKKVYQYTTRNYLIYDETNSSQIAEKMSQNSIYDDFVMISNNVLD